MRLVHSSGRSRTNRAQYSWPNLRSSRFVSVSKDEPSKPAPLSTSIHICPSMLTSTRNAVTNSAYWFLPRMTTPPTQRVEPMSSCILV